MSSRARSTLSVGAAIPALLLLLALPAFASDAAPAAADDQSEQWLLDFTPYLFLSGVSGSVSAGDFTAPINSSFSDIVKNLRVGLFMSFSARKGQWGYLADFEYISLEGSGSGRVPANLTMDTLIGEVDLTFGPELAPSLRFLGGLRVFDLDQTLSIDGDPSLGTSTTVLDPVLGAVGLWQIDDNWHYEMRGDIGGFGISSELTYQLMMEFQWRISDSVGMPFGYRIISYQIQKDSVRLDTRLAGLFLGVDIRF